MGKDLRGLILGTQDITKEKVHITEWDVDVFVKGLTGAERDSYEQSLFTVSEHGKKVDVKMNRANFRRNCWLKQFVLKMVTAYLPIVMLKPWALNPHLH